MGGWGNPIIPQVLFPVTSLSRYSYVSLGYREAEEVDAASIQSLFYFIVKLKQ